VFAARKCRVGLVICSVGLVRVGLPKLITNMICLAWFVTRAALV
jgi:hypothetical protein